MLFGTWLSVRLIVIEGVRLIGGPVNRDFIVAAVAPIPEIVRVNKTTVFRFGTGRSEEPLRPSRSRPNV